MEKGISADSQIHISYGILFKAIFIVSLGTGLWYQAQMKFAEIDRRLEGYCTNGVSRRNGTGTYKRIRGNGSRTKELVAKDRTKKITKTTKE